MKQQVALLCDHLEVTDRNLLNIYHGGICAIQFKKLPDNQSMFFVFAIEYDRFKENGDHIIEIRVIDARGKDTMEPEILDVYFDKEYNAYEGWVKLLPKFDKFEMHNVLIAVDGIELASLELDIRLDTTVGMRQDRNISRFKIQNDGTILLNRDYNNEIMVNGRIDSQNLSDTNNSGNDKARLKHDDICLVMKYMVKLKLELTGFQSNDVLELFFDIKKDNKDICYISKGWKDPGFRIGEYMEISKNIPNFKEKFYKIFKACTNNLIAIDISEPQKGKIGLNLQIGLYELNERVLTEAIDSLEDSLKKIRALLKT